MPSLKDSLKENLNSKLNLATLKPIMDKIAQLEVKFDETLEKRFPKEKRNELKEKVLTNLKETRSEVENRARVLAEKSKDSPLVLNYLRPFVGSEKTNEVLTNLGSRVSSAAPMVRKLQTLRQQFLDLTAPKTEESSNEKAPVKKAKSSRAKAEKSSTEA